MQKIENKEQLMYLQSCRSPYLPFRGLLFVLIIFPWSLAVAYWSHFQIGYGQGYAKANEDAASQLMKLQDNVVLTNVPVKEDELDHKPDGCLGCLADKGMFLQNCKILYSIESLCLHSCEQGENQI